jgi:hypothetical protein
MYPQLPAEIWSEILQYVDDPYDLWVSCRRVSSVVKSQAERIFRHEFLPDVRIEWEYNKDEASYRNFGHEEALKIWSRLDDPGTDPQSDIAFFTIRWEPFHSDDEVRCGASVSTLEGRMKLLKLAADRKDVNAPARGENTVVHDGFYHTMKVWFEIEKSCWRYDPNDYKSYLNDPEIPDIQVHAIEPDTRFPSPGSLLAYLSCDWKKLMDSLFAEELFVRRRMAESGLTRNQPPNLTTLLEDAERSLRADCPSFARLTSGKCTYGMDISDVATYDDVQKEYEEAVMRGCYPRACEHLYAAAYEARLRNGYRNAKKRVPSQRSRNPNMFRRFRLHVHDHVFNMQNQRLELFQKQAISLWFEAFQINDNQGRGWNQVSFVERPRTGDEDSSRESDDSEDSISESVKLVDDHYSEYFGI